ncbi:hypothetical protein ACFVWY_16215 [Streptomyces sp. NPDC058195]|uniref:hypothetical protein n=1 Tax=Streptomyces sp. NPDC058195 TaxID=3346375 RepID=UPI0036F18A1A
MPRKSRCRPQDLVRPLELGVLLAQRGQLGAFAAGEQVVTFAGTGLGLTDPTAQGTPISSAIRRITGFGSAARYIRTARSRNSSGYFLGAGINRAPPCESHLTYCHHFPHLGGTSHSSYVSGKPDSPGYTDGQKAEVARYGEELLRLSIEVSAHPFWDTIDSGERAGARMALKRAPESGGEV